MGLYTTDYVAKAAKLLVEDILGPYGWAGKVSFVSTGSEAVEKALIIAKLVRNRPNIVTRELAYHGWTMGAVGCTRLRGLRGGLSGPTQPDTMRSVPNLPGGGFIVASAPNCYDCSLGHTYPECKQGYIVTIHPYCRSASEWKQVSRLGSACEGQEEVKAYLEIGETEREHLKPL